MPSMQQRVSASGDYKRRPVGADLQPIQHTGRQEMDDRRGEVFQFLGEAGHRLLHLLEGLSLQSGLPALGEPIALPADGLVPEKAHAVARLDPGWWHTAPAELVVEPLGTNRLES